MEWMIWLGAGLTLIGIVGLFYCVFRAIKTKRSGLSDPEIKAALKSVVAINLAALMVSAFGLMAVIVGIVLS